MAEGRCLARGKARSLKAVMGAIVTSGPPAPTRGARLQSLLTPTEDERRERARRPAARSRRDWVVDTACFLIAVAGGIYGPGALLASGAEPSSAATALIAAAGVAACIAIWLRRRWPIAVGLLTVVLGSVSPAAGGASIIALFTVAVHRRSFAAMSLTALAVALLPVYFSLYPDDVPFWVNVGLATGIQAAVVAWGMFIRSQRELMLALRERTRQAEAERDLRVSQARSQERTRIAREMHDVLAHRISLLSLHAGALEVRPDAPPAEIARAAGVVRACAREALEDLREVIGVLRTEPVAGEAERPQPTIADVADLVEESRAAGTVVSLEQRVDGDGLPAAVGRTVYRIVQEGLTNARKHAPGAAVIVTIDGARGDGLTLEVISRRPLAQLGLPEIPGAGAGLIGLAERASLAGGRLEYGRTDAGDYRLWAWLPWPA
jgi:signal transduction histidine kinase